MITDRSTREERQAEEVKKLRLLDFSFNSPSAIEAGAYSKLLISNGDTRALLIPEVLLGLGIEEFHKGNYDTASNFFERLRTEHPRKVGSILSSIDYLREMGNWSEAQKAFHHVAHSTDLFHVFYIEGGWISLMADDPIVAEYCFDRAISGVTRCDGVRGLLIAYALQGKFDKILDFNLDTLEYYGEHELAAFSVDAIHLSRGGNPDYCYKFKSSREIQQYLYELVEEADPEGRFLPSLCIALALSGEFGSKEKFKSGKTLFNRQYLKQVFQNIKDNNPFLIPPSVLKAITAIQMNASISISKIVPLDTNRLEELKLTNNWEFYAKEARKMLLAQPKISKSLELDIGWELIYAGELELAEDWLNRLVRLNHKSVEARFGLLVTSVFKRDFDKALELAEEIRSLSMTYIKTDNANLVAQFTIDSIRLARGFPKTDKNNRNPREAYRSVFRGNDNSYDRTPKLFCTMTAVALAVGMIEGEEPLFSSDFLLELAVTYPVATQRLPRFMIEELINLED